jgi:hypothetical protein
MPRSIRFALVERRCGGRASDAVGLVPARPRDEIKWPLGPRPTGAHASPPIRVQSPTACIPLHAASDFGQTLRGEGRLDGKDGWAGSGGCRHQAPTPERLGSITRASRRQTLLASRPVALPCGAGQAFPPTNLTGLGAAIAPDREPGFEALRRALLGLLGRRRSIRFCPMD